jgi:hypothetical protein
MPAPAEFRPQLWASAYRGLSTFLDVLCDPQEPAQRLWAETALGEFLHAVCDSSHQQFAAEVSGRLSFVETMPLLTQFADIEREEAR